MIKYIRIKQDWETFSTQNNIAMIETNIGCHSTQDYLGSYKFEIYDDLVKLEAVWINEIFRGKGFAQGLISDALSEFKKLNRDELWLVVNKTNTIAIKLYEKNGFVYDQDYEGDEENFSWMKFILK